METMLAAQGGGGAAPPPELVANFVSITDCSPDIATRVLQAADNNMEEAVNLFFASGGAEAWGGAPPQAAPRAQPAGGLGGFDMGDGMDAWVDDEDERPLRAPEPRYLDTLRGPGAAPPPQLEPLDLLAGARAGPLPRGARAPVQMDTFRDLRAEAMADESLDEEEGERGGGRGAGAAGAAGGQARTLASLFAPPTEVLYTGNFEQARAAAEKLDRWLLVNVQSDREFASHTLNRDTWRNETIASMLATSGSAGTFLFMQLDGDHEEEGRKILSFYQLMPGYGIKPTLPVTLLIDPITGQQMKLWKGAFTPDKFLDDTQSYCDAPPSQSTHHKKMRPAAASAAAAAAASARGVDDEDEALRNAIAASLLAAGTGPEAAAAAFPPAAQAEEAVAAQQQSAAIAAAAAAAAAQARAILPAEPATGIQVGLRTPVSPARLTRKFPAGTPVSAVRAWALLEVEEAVAGRAFKLAGPPGLGPELMQALSENGGLEGGPSVDGLAGVLLTMTWVA